jgi:hypothetical protein
LKWTPHPYLHTPTTEEIDYEVNHGRGAKFIADLHNRREERIAMAEVNPLRYGFEPPTWRDADQLMMQGYIEAAAQPDRTMTRKEVEALAEEISILGIFGGNRAAKSEYAAKRVCECAMTFPKSVIVCLAEKDETSAATMQKTIWKFIKPYFEHLNGKRHAVYKVNYTQANGFADGKLVLPNGSEVYFLTYGQEAGDYEGWEFGAMKPVYAAIAEKLRAGLVPDGGDEIQRAWWTYCAGRRYVPINIGAWADESLTCSWLGMLSRRLPFRKAKMPWTFTPVKGITPAVKEFVGSSAVTLEWRPSPLLPRKNLPDGPAGHMPYVRKPIFKKSRAIYFFSEYNLFGGYYEEIKQLCDGKNSEYVERVAYGFARDSASRAFPKFGPWNIVKRSQLPAIGTNYMFTDPAGIRNWATIWVRVTPGDRPSLYIYRDWPDAQRYGEWAVPTEREVSEENRKGWDGDVGPAQASFGYGITRYKQLFLEEERIEVPTELMEQSQGGAATPPYLETALARVVDPHHRRRIEQALKRKQSLTDLREEIMERYIDPRAAANEHVAEEGGTCILWMMQAEERDASGNIIAPAMDFTPANGEKHDMGLTAIKELMDWNNEKPMVPILNAPRLFVCEDCLQVRWMLENFTGLGGEKGACKDFADLLRYMALADLVHIEPGRLGSSGGGSY